LEVIELNGLPHADSPFGGLDNIDCESDVLESNGLSLADSSFGAIDNIDCESVPLKIE
jgi:hypothetical protein